MIERKVVAEKMKEFQIQEYIAENLRNSGHSHTKVQRTPLGEKIIIFASRPGLIVGRKGQNIKKLTMDLKNRFNLENPQIEISEVENVEMDAAIVSERIAASLEKFGSARFKGIVHKVMQDVMNAGALGIEIVISGKVPSTRAKSWRFYQGYLKKCGDISLTGVNKAISAAKLKSGVIGVKVSIMPPTTKLPDDMQVSDIPFIIEEHAKVEKERKKTKKKSERKAKPKQKKEAEETKAKERAKETPEAKGAGEKPSESSKPEDLEPKEEGKEN